MKLRTKSLIIIMIALFTVLLIGTTSVRATDDLIADIRVLDKNGNDVCYYPPQSGGPGAILNTDKDYTDCIYEMQVDNNYGETIKTDFGTFTFKEKTEHTYYYTCPVKPEDITSRSGELNYTFKATNADTKEVDTLNAWFYFYKVGFENNSNLKVNNEYIIKDGKVVADGSNEKPLSPMVRYYEDTNTLSLGNGKYDVYYSNMGSTFNIEKDEECTYTVFNDDNIKKILEELGFKKDTYMYMYSHNECVDIDKLGQNISEFNEMLEKIKKLGLTLENSGSRGSISFREDTYTMYKNGINFGELDIATYLQYKIIVPNDIEENEIAFLKYATQRIKEYTDKEYSGDKDVTFNKINGSWYDCPILETQVIIQKEYGTPVGNNIYVDGLEQNVNIKVEVKENTKMNNEVKVKGYTNIIGTYELILEGATQLTNPINITFNVGTNYNGKTVYILHQKKDGTYEHFEQVVKDGKITITVNELSPFVLAVKETTNNKGELDETPKTGTTDLIKYILPITLMSAVGIVALRKKKETK